MPDLKKTCYRLFSVLVLLSATSAVLADASVDRLVSVLVAKGMLTADEAEEVLGEMQALSEQPVPAARATPAPSGETLPERLRVSGNMRFRYQWNDNRALPPELEIPEEAGKTRFQAKLGLDYVFDQRWTVGLGLSSGGSDPRSSNQTFSDGFPTYDARIDYAYARFAYNERLSGVIGKFKNPIYTSANLLWDSDIRPEGIMGHYIAASRGNMNLNLRGGMLILSDKESGSRDDAFMYVAQAHWNWQPSEALRIDLAPAYYVSTDLAGTSGLTEFSVPTNSRDVDGNLLFDYDAATVSGKLAWLPGAYTDYLELVGEYVYAPDPSDDNTGWLLGIRTGKAGLDKLGDWQLEYNYRRLERDAWPEFLQDSDFLFGATNVKGHELSLEVAITSQLSFGLDYYLNNKVIGSDIEQDLLQVDLNLNW